MSVSLPITTRPRAGFLSYHTDSPTRGKENTRPKNQRHFIWLLLGGFRSYQMCGHRCRICSKWGCGRSGFAYRVNGTSSKLTNPLIRFLQMGLGRETPLSTFAVGSGCRCSKRGFWLGWVNVKCRWFFGRVFSFPLVEEFV